MKAIIWIGCLSLNGLIVTGSQMGGLGAGITTFVCTSLAFYLCKKIG